MANRNQKLKTIKVPVEKYEEAKAQKESAGRTWGEQLVASETETIEVVPADDVLDDDARAELARQVAAELQR